MTGDLLQAAGALLAGLGLAFLLGRLARGSRLAGAAPGARLSVAAALAVDARRRALILRVDGRELLLVGDQVVGWLPEGPRP
ncbi:MAG: flagellar biosynthetic protein FliO [Rubritepida sp.]|nr:flagellar biosynthetic protein FliO [Rubritepida sp.]